MTSKNQRLPESSDRVWFPSLLLITLVCAAVIGVLSGSSPSLMILVSTLALGFWEIAEQVAQRLRSNNFQFDNLFKWVPGKLLIASVGISLLLAEGGLQLQLRPPFGIVILAVLLILFGFTRFYRAVMK